MLSRLIIGIGNILRRDDGLGVHAVREILKRDLPPDIKAIDAGTQIVDLVSEIQFADKIVVIDALKGGMPPGTIYRIAVGDLNSSDSRPLSVHQITLLEVLDIVRKLGSNPEVVIFGMEPAELEWNLELSPVISNKLPHLVELVLKELQIK